MSQELKIEYLPVEELEEYANNTRKHNEPDVSQIAKSIEKYGFNDPLGVWSDHNVIVEGHGRLQAAKMLGLETVPVIHLDHMTDAQRREYGIAHNKTAELSEWDFNALDAELAELDFSDFNFGFDDPVDVDGFGDDFTLPDGDKPEMCTMSFALHQRQKDLLEYALECVADEITETFGNTNKNGNALYEVVRQWAELKK